MAALGGASRIDHLRTLELRGRIESGRDTHSRGVPMAVYFMFPDRYRCELRREGETVATVLNSKVAFLAGPKGAVVLGEPERRALETTAMRNLVALLKGRRHDLFSAWDEGSVTVGGVELQILRIDVIATTTRLYLDPATGRPVRMVYREGPDEITDSFSDLRESAGLIYPFAVESSRQGHPETTMIVESVEVDQPLPDSLFEMP